MNKKTKKTVFIGVMAALIAALSVWQIPFPFGVPLTFQVFAAALSGYVLGAGAGTLAVLAYLLLGAVGVPVFGGFSGGAAVIAGPTGGFLLGFLPLSTLCGAGAVKKAFPALMLGALGLIICHIAGTLQYLFVMKSTFQASFLFVSLPYLPKDALLIAAAYFVSLPVKKVI